MTGGRMHDGKVEGRGPTIVRFIAAVVLATCPQAAGSKAQPDPSPPDWMSQVPRSLSSAPIRPPDGAELFQAPPDFSWPDPHGNVPGRNSGFRITLTYPDGRERSRSTTENWINWDEVLPAGRYGWRVDAGKNKPAAGQVHPAATGPAPTDAVKDDAFESSRMRFFTVTGCAKPFLVPDADELLRRAKAKPRPRSLPQKEMLTAMFDERREGFGGLLKRVNAKMSAGLPNPPPTGPEGDIEKAAFDEIERAMDALVVFAARGDDRFYEEALRRALHIAAWDPHGATSYAHADQVARGAAGALAFAYDVLFPRLAEPQKQRLMEALRPRVKDMYEDLVASRKLAVHPLDSHGNHTLAYLAAITVLLAGDLPEADQWLRAAVPLAINWSSPWGGEDGGFANGTAYAQWVTGDTLFAWNILRLAVGVDVAQKAWQRNHAYFLAYFLPPGTPSGAFGDAAERQLPEQWGRFGSAYSLFAPNPVTRWYASELPEGDESLVISLLKPMPVEGPAVHPASLPNSAYFPSIGWVAMHSDLADRKRTSIYFKSSPFGSFNHSHADQNSFVINAGGEPLAIDSGYYDDYGSPHWNEWYKQTRAHNAITFDGGKGQKVFEKDGGPGAGTITRFDRRDGFVLVTGDATDAYGGDLERAVRTMVYVPPNLLIVYDQLESPVDRRWEWNIHAQQRMTALGTRSIQFRAGLETMCLDMLASPDMAFEQSDRFSTPPGRGEERPQQWHGAFVAKQPSSTAEFVALLGIGCPAPRANITREGDRWHLQVDGRQFALQAGQVEAEPLPGEGAAPPREDAGNTVVPHPGMSCAAD